MCSQIEAAIGGISHVSSQKENSVLQVRPTQISILRDLFILFYFCFVFILFLFCFYFIFVFVFILFLFCFYFIFVLFCLFVCYLFVNWQINTRPKAMCWPTITYRDCPLSKDRKLCPWTHWPWVCRRKTLDKQSEYNWTGVCIVTSYKVLIYSCIFAFCITETVRCVSA